MSRKPLHMYGTSKRGQQYIKKVNQIKAREMFSKKEQICLSEEEKNEKDVIIIPNGVQKIEKETFKDCQEYVKKVILPDTVKEIGSNAFDHCTSLQELILPNSLENIGDYAFAWCESLQKIIVPDSVKDIGRNAFHGCSNLQKITLPDSLKNISYCEFIWCRSLQNIILPNSIRTIKESAFSDCTSLQKVILPDSVVSIGVYAFRNCTNLQEIVLPDSISVMHENPFMGCTSLQKIICCSCNLEFWSSYLNFYDNLTIKEVLVPTTEIKERFSNWLAKLKVYDANIQVVDTEQLMAIYKNQTKELNNTFVNNSQKLSKSNKSYNGIIRKNLLKRK